MLRLWPPLMVERRVNDVREYMRTDLSEKHTAIMGRSGWADADHARENEGGVMVDRRFSILHIIIGCEANKRLYSYFA